MKKSQEYDQGGALGLLEARPLNDEHVNYGVKSSSVSFSLGQALINLSRVKGGIGMKLSGIMIGSENPNVLGEFYTKIFGEPGWQLQPTRTATTSSSPRPGRAKPILLHAELLSK